MGACGIVDKASPQIVDGPELVCLLNPTVKGGILCDGLSSFSQTSVTVVFERAF